MSDVTRIRLRRGTEQQWSSANPVLSFGEIGVEAAPDGSVRFKLGDNFSLWSDLEYFEPGSFDDFVSASDIGSPLGIASLDSNGQVPLTQLSSATSFTNSAVASHNLSTLNVHGIADTSKLATVDYVDNLAAGIIAKPAVLAASTENVPGIYSNGNAGVGATLTANSNGQWPGLDGVTSGWEIGSGILLKDQSNPAENGRWVLIDTGSPSTPWILRRCGLCDEPSEIPGMYIFVISGDANGASGYVAIVNDPSTFQVGVDAINMVQFTSSFTLSGGAGILVSGTQVSIDSSVVATLASPTFTGTVTAPQFSGQLTGSVQGTSSNSEKIDNRKIFVQASAPTSAQSANGDIWIKT